MNLISLNDERIYFRRDKERNVFFCRLRNEDVEQVLISQNERDIDRILFKEVLTHH